MADHLLSTRERTWSVTVGEGQAKRQGLKPISAIKVIESRAEQSTVATSSVETRAKMANYHLSSETSMNASILVLVNRFLHLHRAEAIKCATNAITSRRAAQPPLVPFLVLPLIPGLVTPVVPPSST